MIGRDTTSTGTVLISGPGAIWKHTSPDVTQPAVMVVGQSGPAQFTVADGGACQADALEIGADSILASVPTGAGQVTVQGSGATLTVKELTVGTDKPALPAPGEQPLGHGTLTVLDNGTVNVQAAQPGDPVVVLSAAQFANSIAVSRFGSLNAPNSTLVLAGFGPGLSITDGG
jgi:T5SS/PEP-CTERM-associated repeat protein